MKKKGAKKLTKISPIKTPKKTEKILLENFVELQKVMVSQSIKFDELTKQISKLLELFETSAKTLAEKNFDLEKSGKDNKKIIEKIDTLLEQNKILAKGLTLMHESKLVEGETVPLPQGEKKITGVPRIPSNTDEYQKSISSET
jgi:seryl-tRNA synthetase